MEQKNYIITHTLSNGVVLNDLKGYRVPVTEETKAFYISLASYAKKKRDKTA